MVKSGHDLFIPSLAAFVGAAVCSITLTPSARIPSLILVALSIVLSVGYLSQGKDRTMAFRRITALLVAILSLALMVGLLR